MSIQCYVACLDCRMEAPRVGDGGFLGAPSLDLGAQPGWDCPVMPSFWFLYEPLCALAGRPRRAATIGSRHLQGRLLAFEAKVLNAADADRFLERWGPLLTDDQPGTWRLNSALMRPDQPFIHSLMTFVATHRGHAMELALSSPEG